MHYYQSGEIPIHKLHRKVYDSFYKAPPGLIGALNTAIELQMPLLLTGEPGTGKTAFAYHLSDHFSLGETLVFHSKTNSQARDLFYSYDPLKHFHIVNNLKREPKDLNAEGIIKYQALGKAIIKAKEKKERSIVLIDEIDKTNQDFPNDLLHTLEGQFSFELPDLNEEEICAPENLKPIVVITSNSERGLPEPFLRRCIYYHISPPGEEELIQIILGKIDGTDVPSFFGHGELKAFLLDIFFPLREISKKEGGKPPSTAELLSWIHILYQKKIKPDHFERTHSNFKEASREHILISKRLCKL